MDPTYAHDAPRAEISGPSRSQLTSPRPSRRRRPLSEHEVFEHRDFACSSYEACLDTAVGGEWASWTCAECPRFERHQPAIADTRTASKPIEIECACGAVGRSLPPEGYQRETLVPVVEWRGGNIGPGRLAVEELPEATEHCPACRHRACIFMLRAG